MPTMAIKHRPNQTVPTLHSRNVGGNLKKTQKLVTLSILILSNRVDIKFTTFKKDEKNEKSNDTNN